MKSKLEELFENENTTDEERIEIIKFAQTVLDNSKQFKKCIRCRHILFFASHSKALCEGHVYSQNGIDEADISGYCEFCFDELFEEKISKWFTN